MNSNDIAIRVENLGKMYRLGREIPHASTLAGKIKQAVAAPFGWLASQMGQPSEAETLWALRNVSFEVKRGEVVGIIGHNGAGKSTLLKILSRITEPTEGHAEIHGRIAALLEVGTGMHPELTGRENIYMNGTVLGMKKREIDRKLDEIIEFSGVEKFLETMVKHYSSGMRVRLGFAIAAHLEPEILVVDEVLAVGDLNFQKKCLGKMRDVAKGGRTVLFVSHRMEAVRALCSRALLIHHGGVTSDGNVEEVIQVYYEAIRNRGITEDLAVCDSNHRRGSGQVRYTSIRVLNDNGTKTDTFEPGSDIAFHLNYVVHKPVNELYLRVGFRSATTGEFVTLTPYHVVSKDALPKGHQGKLKLLFPEINFRLGDYPIYLWLGTSDFKPYDVADDLVLPLMIRSTKSTEELGYDNTRPAGYFNIHSTLKAIV